MNLIIKKSLRNFKFVFFAQVLTMFFGLFSSIVIPMILSVEDFGFWQLYLFYASYVGVFALGFNDGIYLRYGSYDYNSLPFGKLRTSTRIHVLVLVVFTLLFYFLSLFEDSSMKSFVLYAVSLNIIIMGLNGVLVYIFQITNKMKEFSLFLVIPKLLFLISSFLFLYFEIFDLKIIIYADIIFKIIVVILMIYLSKELWVGPNSKFKLAFREYIDNVSVGIMLMIAQLSGMLILGVGRFIVEMMGNINEFAYYSFGITITNFVLVFITSVSLIAYPTLKRLEELDYPSYFNKINEVLRLISYLVPIVYFCSILVVNKLLPDYSPVLNYLNILFCIIIVQAKMQLLINTFFKVLRQELEVMKTNIIGLVVFSILAPILYSFTLSVWYIAISTLLIMVWRCYKSEVFLRKLIEIENSNKIFSELLFLVLFVVLTSLLNIYVCLVLYLLFVLMYVTKYIVKKEIDWR
ncbi:hypothetical protein [Paenibacillus sp. 1P07SE]|uniref:hypothetical protein n=1 Tax=Paenibacillus sp. 1P07SE TaxID=3132209 RepID=UPI0039A451A7